MTKPIALLTSLLILLTAGCAAASKQDTLLAKPPETPMPEAASPQSALRYQADTVLFEDAVTAEDGKNVLTYSYRVPELTVLRGDGSEITAAETAAEEQALGVADTFNARFADWTSEESVQDWSREASDYLAFCQEENIPWNGGYWLELSSSVYQTEKLVSVAATYYSFTGGAHPNTYHMSWNYDLETATFFDPKLLGKDTDFQEAVAAEIIRQAQETQQDGMRLTELYWDDYETIIADWSSYAVSFQDSGMTVIFSPYELAPYAVGTQEFFLPYQLIAEYLSEDGKTLLELNGI